MTDKVQKIKEWISKEQDGLMDAQGNFEYPEHEGAYHILCSLDAYIDSLQEEPVCELLNTESMIESYKQRLISQANGMKNSPLVDMCLVSYKHGINETLDTLNLSNVERTIKNWKEVPVSGNIDFEQELYKAFGQVKDFTLCMQIAKWFYDMGKNNGKEHISEDKLEGLRNAFRLALDDEEPVSEDLEDAAEDYCKSTLVGSHSIKKNAFKAGAQWQKKKDQKK